jgi:SAM-dependent methyltransferase
MNGMADSSTGGLQLWDGWRPSAPADAGASVDLATRLFALEAAGARGRSRAEPFSLQWFQDVEAARHTRQGRWLPRLLEFSRHEGDTLLGLGEGIGTDWAAFAAHGVDVIACSPDQTSLSLVQRQFQLRGLKGRCLLAHPSALPLPAASIDVACITSLLPLIAAPEDIVAEVYRVLRPGGKVMAVVPARYDATWWGRGWLPWRRRPVSPHTFGTGRLKQLFGRFSEQVVHQRHLRRSDVPHLWRWLPLAVLERLVGRFLILKGFKPLSAAMQSVRAA